MRELNDFLKTSSPEGEVKIVNGKRKFVPKEMDLDDPADNLAVWEDLNSRFSPESLSEDGELSKAEARRKEKELIKIAVQLRKRSGPMPTEVAEWWEGPKHLTRAS